MPTFDHLSSDFDGVIFTGPGAAGGPIIVTQDGIVSITLAGNAFDLSDGPYTLGINGMVYSELGDGVQLGASTSAAASKITVGASGFITGSVRGIDSSQAVNISNAGVISGDEPIFVVGGTTSFTIINTGLIAATAIGGISIGGAATSKHTITNSGELFGYIFAGNGMDTVKNSGFIENSINTGDEADSVTNTGKIGSGVFLDAGNDKFSNSGSIGQLVYGGAGTDVLTNSGSIGDSVDAGDDNDKFTNTGTVVLGVAMGKGDDTFSNTGTIGALDGGEGKDTATNKGSIVANVTMGSEDDKFTNSGHIGSDVEMNGGNDLFTNTGLVDGDIYLGSGNDIFKGGAKAENVTDEEGSDGYSLGDGFDTFDAINAAGFSNIGADTVDGGTNKGSNPLLGLYGDHYDASDATGDLRINLDSVDHTGPISNVLVLANSATGDAIGTDTIKNFEWASGGAGLDIIYGNAVANFIDGGGALDQLYGGNGNDQLFGNSGGDYLLGGAGRDMLAGFDDSGGDGEADVFVYAALSDSTAALSGRDLILDFEDGIDSISFSLLAGLNFFNVISGTTNFSGIANDSELRAVKTTFGWVLQLDADGDKKVDLAIDVLDETHAINWDANGADFQV